MKKYTQKKTQGTANNKAATQALHAARKESNGIRQELQEVSQDLAVLMHTCPDDDMSTYRRKLQLVRLAENHMDTAQALIASALADE